MDKRRILYLECQSGISGDMAVAALLDLGADRKKLEETLAGLGLDGYTVTISRVKKCGLDACDFNVIPEEKSPHKHDHSHDHHHSHEHAHPHRHDSQPERNLQDITRIIAASPLSPNAQAMAEKIFRVLAEAEAEAHGLPLEEVHFHEVGALDSLVDILSVAVCADDIGADDIVISSLTEGCGHIHCQHGLLPVPVPAVLNIARAHGLSLRLTDNDGEMITPTGAAIAAALKTRNRLPETFTVHAVGLGAGKKDFTQANLLRALIIEEKTA